MSSLWYAAYWNDGCCSSSHESNDVTPFFSFSLHSLCALMVNLVPSPHPLLILHGLYIGEWNGDLWVLNEPLNGGISARSTKVTIAFGRRLLCMTCVSAPVSIVLLIIINVFPIHRGVHVICSICSILSTK